MRVVKPLILLPLGLLSSCLDFGPLQMPPNYADMATPPDLSHPVSDLALGPRDLALGPPDLSPPVLVVPAGCTFTTVRLADFYAAVITSNCATAGCHISGGTLPRMDTSAIFFASTVSASSSNGMKYITPGNANTSYLLYKVMGQQAKVTTSPGNQMPNGKPALSPTQQCQLINWVLSGALM